MLDAQLEKAVLSQRDELEPWRILGDALEASGDPRGRLVGLMLANETKPALKLITAWKDWLKAHAAALVPAGLDEKTLGWRRGFLSVATLPGAKLLELCDHPSLRFLDHAVLEAGAPVSELEGRRMPWRTVELSLRADETDEPLQVIRACPWLTRLVLMVPDGQDPVRFAESPTVRELEVIGGTPHVLLEASRAFGGLKSLRLEAPRRSPTTSEWLELNLLPRLDRLVVERASYEELAEALEHGRPKRLGVLNEYEDESTPGVVSDIAEREDAWLIFAPFDAEAAVKDFAFGNQVRELVARSATVQLGGRELSVLRLHAPEDALTLANCAEAIATRGGSSRCLGFATSDNHHQAVAWVVKNGPARSAVQLEEASNLLRRSVELLFGIDPGPHGLGELKRALHGVAAKTLLGSRRDSDALPPMVTDVEVVPHYDDELGDGEYEDEEEDEYPDWEAIEEAEEKQRLVEEERAATPVMMPSESESVVTVVPAVLDVAPPVLSEDGEPAADEDEDEEPFRDALDATIEDIWTQTPVEPDEDFDEPATKAFDEPPEVEGVKVEGEGAVAQQCAHCGTVATTDECLRCGDAVCSTCGDGDEGERVCFECEPARGT